ncbi:MAG: V-type ATP synthase subunit E [Clostridia bacterium]|nr:V-type ATP synthase subunit E [Clostridia bacterium]
MSSGEKIIAEIRHECDEKISAINAETEDVCASIIDSAKKKASDITKNAQYKLEEQSSKLLKAHQSKCELEKRNMLLKARRQEIDNAVEHILDHMTGLPSKVYFELVYKLAVTSDIKDGTVYLNSKDLKRLPKNFQERLAESGMNVTISDTPDESIESGFILKNGDIEENLSFSSIIAEKREEIEDLISRELFKD